MHQNFEVIAGLNYRFIGNQRVHVFSTCKTEIMTNTNDFNHAAQVQAGVLKTFAELFL